jgi:tetratricopeptide (TPR) repeat protein
MTWLLAVLMLAGKHAGTAPEQIQAQEHVKEGDRLLASERYPEALEAYGTAIQLDPMLMMAHYGAGQAHMALKEYPAAIISYKDARDAFESRRAANVLLLQQNESARQDRIRDLRDKISQNQQRALAPDSQEARERERRITQWEAEITMLDRSEGISSSVPLPPGLSLALGSAYFRSGQLADAEREYRAAIGVQPKLGEPRNNLAVVLFLTGRAAEAQEQVKLAEKHGFKVAPGLKSDIETALVTATPTPKP